MTETVAEALSRHEADCPVCKANYAPHCGERETVEELATLRAELAALRCVPCIDCHGTGKCACGDCKGQTCALCGGAGQTATLTHDDVAREMQRLRSRLTDAEAERDRYLTRACVAEAKVAEVRELADSYVAKPCHSGCGRPDYHGCTCNAGDFRKAGKAILAAIGGKP